MGRREGVGVFVHACAGDGAPVRSVEPTHLHASKQPLVAPSHPPHTSFPSLFLRFYKNWYKSKKKAFTKYVKKYADGKKEIDAEIEQVPARPN